MSIPTTARRLSPADASPTYPSRSTLADDHRGLLRGVEHRVAAIDALIDARSWPHSELATLAGFLRAALLRQVSDEESLLYPHDAGAAPFAELSAGHARLYELIERVDEAREQHCSLPQLRAIVDDLLATLRTHVDEEEAVFDTLASTDLRTGPVVIRLDALPTATATQLCVERVLRLQPGEEAVIHSRDRTRLHDVRAWLHAFDAGRFALAIASDRDGGARLDVACRTPR